MSANGPIGLLPLTHLVETLEIDADSETYRSATEGLPGATALGSSKRQPDNLSKSNTRDTFHVLVVGIQCAKEPLRNRAISSQEHAGSH